MGPERQARFDAVLLGDQTQVRGCIQTLLILLYLM